MASGLQRPGRYTRLRGRDPWTPCRSSSSRRTVIGCDPLVVTFENDTRPPVPGQQRLGLRRWRNGRLRTALVPCVRTRDLFSDLTVTTPAGCVDALTQTDLVRGPDGPFLTDPNPTTIQQSTVVMTSTDPNAVAWLVGPGWSSGSPERRWRPSSPSQHVGGQYLVCLQVVDQHGCEDQQCQLVVVRTLLRFIPNAFPPTGTGVNDVFFPVLAGNDLGGA